MAMVRSRRCDVLVVTHMDRLYRRVVELEDIIPVVEETDVKVVSIDGSYDLSTPMGRLVARNLCSAAQAEVEIKAERNVGKNIQAAKSGVRNKSGCRPFGYCGDRFTPMNPGVALSLVHGTARNGCPTVDGPGWPSAEPWEEISVRVPETAYGQDGRVIATQSEADAIRDAIAAVLRGGSITSIERKWHALGFRPPLAPYGPLPGGNPWSHHTVRRILTNPHIAGWRSYRNGEIMAPGNWPPIVSITDFEAAKVILTDPSRVKPRGALSLLGGIAECRCGKPVQHAARKDYGTYRCTAFKDGGAAATGPHVAMKCELIDQYVSDVLVETMGQPDAVTMFADDAEKVDIPALKERLTLLDSALAKLSLQNAMGQIPDSVFAVNSAEISAEREQIGVQVAEAGQVNVAAVLLTSSDVRATWDGMDISEQRAAIRKLMRVTLRTAGCGCRKPDLDRIVRIAWRIPAAA
jgi:hypothetical protein